MRSDGSQASGWEADQPSRSDVPRITTERLLRQAMARNRTSLEQWLYFGRPSAGRSIARVVAAVVGIALLVTLAVAIVLLPSDWGTVPWPPPAVRLLVIGGLAFGVALVLTKRERT